MKVPIVSIVVPFGGLPFRNYNGDYRYTIVHYSVVGVCHCRRSAASKLMMLPLSKEEPLLLPPEDVPVARNSTSKHKTCGDVRMEQI